MKHQTNMDSKPVRRAQIGRPHILTPYDMVQRTLNESQHIFKLNDFAYDNAIKTALNNAIYDYKNQNNLTKLNGFSYALATIDYPFEMLNTIYLYVRILPVYVTEEKCFNLSYPEANLLYEHESPIYDEQEKTIQVYNKETKLLDNKIIKEVKAVSIVCDFTTNVYDSKLTEHYVGMIRHELIHVLHELHKTVINMHAGNAYYWAAEMCKKAGVPFPITAVIKNINLNNIKLPNIILTVAACFYYLSTSEYSAWLDTYYIQNLLWIRYGFHNKEPLSKIEEYLETPDPWVIMYFLKYMLDHYKNDILLVFHNSDYSKLINQYFNDSAIKPIPPKNLISHWKKRIDTFIEKCKSIHETNKAKYPQLILDS